MNSIDKKTWYVYDIKYAKKTWYGGVFMKKDEILNASRKEHRNIQNFYGAAGRE